MQKYLHIFSAKPLSTVAAFIIYLLVVILLKWVWHPTWNVLLFAIGGCIGFYLLDIAEVFFDVTPSPFRTAFFGTGFIFVSFFVISSTSSYLAGGLVLAFYLNLLTLLYAEYQKIHTFDSWFRMDIKLSLRTQMIGVALFAIVFVLETLLFLKQLPA